MSLSLHTLAPKKGSRVKSFRVGRGYGSGRGTTAGRGTKGQRARTGGRNGLKLKGIKQMLLSFPKARGFQSMYSKPVALPLDRLNVFADGAMVDTRALREKGILRRAHVSAKLVLGSEPLTKKLTIVAIPASAQAKIAIEAAGGSVSAKVKKASKKTVTTPKKPSKAKK